MNQQFQLHNDDCLKVLPTLATARFRCCVTSPPYYGLRDYGVDGQMGLEARHDCSGWATGDNCGECYVCKMRQVFGLVWNVLADDGTLFLNLGDSYAGSGGAHTLDHANPGLSKSAYRNGFSGYVANDGRGKHKPAANGLKPKDLVGIPWRVALALQADGWTLRSDIIWSKPNPMPESVTDRPTKAHEYLFLFSKSEKYFYDADVIKEKAMVGKDLGLLRGRQFVDGQHVACHAPSIKKRQELGVNSRLAGTGYRNKRSVWTITPEPLQEAHFAVMPTKLAEPCILAGSAVGDIVFDPFTGSGTVGLVALRHGRKFVGCEINESYFDMATRRLTDAARAASGQPKQLAGQPSDYSDLALFAEATR